MPLVSLLPEDLTKSFGVQAGRHKVVSSEWLIHQFPPSKDTAKEQSAPFLCWARGFQPVDEADKPIGEVEMDYTLQIVPRDDKGNQLDIGKSKFAPAVVVGQPLQLRVGSKGPYLELIAPKGSISEKSKVGMFLKNLYGLGFNVKKFQDSSLNIGLLVGTIGEVYQLVSKNEGTILNKEGKEEAMKDTKFAAFSKIYQWGYDVASGLTVPNGASGSPASASAGGSAPQVAVDAHGTAVALLKKIAEMTSSAPIGLEDLGKKVLGAWGKLDPKPHPDVRNAAKALLITPDFYSTAGVDEVAVFDGEKVEFA